jgi:hypothetical protein
MKEKTSVHEKPSAKKAAAIKVARKSGASVRRALTAEDAQLDRLAIDLVRRSYTTSTDHKVVDNLAFFGGRLRIVAFTDKDEDSDWEGECYVYTDIDGESTMLADMTEVALRIGRGPVPSLLERVLHFVGVPGLLAVGLTITVSWMLITTGQVPPLLEHSLTAILAFYFGTQVLKGRA